MALVEHDHPPDESCELGLDQRGKLIGELLPREGRRVEQANFNQLVGKEGVLDGGQHGVRETFFANHDDRVQRVGLGAQEAALFSR